MEHTHGQSFLSSLLFSDESAASLPLSFVCGGKKYHGIPEEFHPTVTEIGDAVTETVYTGTGGLRKRYSPPPSVGLQPEPFISSPIAKRERRPPLPKRR